MLWFAPVYSAKTVKWLGITSNTVSMYTLVHIIDAYGQNGNEYILMWLIEKKHSITLLALLSSVLLIG